ncbi:MAG: NAD+ synthase [Gammaproteobacteria bacterium]|nr:MAG: NAD+ synthase [Gammaproteobacteria bacterium]
MTTPRRWVLAQLDFLVGDIPGNAEKILQAADRACQQLGAELIIFPELALTGYPPEDLLLRPSLRVRVDQALAMLAEKLPAIDVILGYPERQDDGAVYNVSALISGGRVQQVYRKKQLPNYQVFDEKRYFTPGHETVVADYKGLHLGLTVCEDIWNPEPARSAALAGADVIININASPYHIGKQQERMDVLRARAKENQVPIVYVNMVGGQDELVFDGGSCVVDASGQTTALASRFGEELVLLNVRGGGDAPLTLNGDIQAMPDEDEVIYQALVTGVRDYVNKNRFPSVVLGLSGGIDSALTLAVAVDALGPERVRAVMMPFRYTSKMSLEDAEQEARTLGVQYDVVPIEPMYEAFLQSLSPLFDGLPPDTTEENLQARIRGVLLMSLSNKTGALVLTTGNKSEMAVGYSTLYGDMAGGFDVLKDVYKTRVYQLARYRNRDGEVIPERVITRPPSAELRPDQKDQDSLPDYDVLDAILQRYIEGDESAAAIIADGFEPETVHRVLRLVDINEYKRRQAPIGVRITARGFGRDRRYPITSGWAPGD